MKPWFADKLSNEKFKDIPLQAETMFLLLTHNNKDLFEMKFLRELSCFVVKFIIL